MRRRGHAEARPADRYLPAPQSEGQWAESLPAGGTPVLWPGSRPRRGRGQAMRTAALAPLRVKGG